MVITVTIAVKVIYSAFATFHFFCIFFACSSLVNREKGHRQRRTVWRGGGWGGGGGGVREGEGVDYWGSGSLNHQENGKHAL